MLDPNTFRTFIARPEAPDQTGGRSSDLLDAMRRQWFLILSSTVIATALGAFYAFTAPSMYIATSQLIIESRKVSPFTGRAVVEEMVIDTTIADSQVEVLKSEAVHLAVIKNLNLLDDPEFTDRSTSLLQSAFTQIRLLREKLGLLNDPELTESSTGLLRSALAQIGLQQPGAESDTDKENRALRHLQDNLTVRRVGRTYVLEVTFRSGNKGTAIKVANALVHAYINNQVRSNAAATAEASAWLKDRLEELRNDAMRADTEVQEYIAKNKLIVAQPGRTLTEQQLTDLQGQLIKLRGEVAEAKARVETLAAAETQGPSIFATVGSFNNPTLTRLRDQYLDAQRRETEFVSHYGENHPAVADIRQIMESLREASRDESRRTATAFKKEYEVARARLVSLEQSLQETLDATATGMRAGVSLRILESSAQSYRRLYDSFLQRFADSQQQQSFLRADASVLTSARESVKSEPKIKFILGSALLAGFASGIGLALVRQRNDLSIRSARKLKEVIGTECFGIVPEISQREAKRHRRTAETISNKVEGIPTQDHAQEHKMSRREPERNLPDLTLERHAAHTPFSEFAETLRRIKIAADLSTSGPIILGVVSTTPEEGASFIAANFAELLAGDGNQTLLIDGDLRQSHLSRQIAPDAKVGLVQLLEANVSADATVWTDPLTGLHFLPSGARTRIANSATVLSSPKFEALLSAFQSKYRYIVIDLPPLEVAVDAQAIGEFIDKFLLIVTWGRTTHGQVESSLRSAEVIRSRLLGGILNKGDARSAKRAKWRTS